MTSSTSGDHDMDFLAKKNCHIKDNNLVFFPDTHIYKVVSDQQLKMTSTTTFVSKLFPKFDAAHMSRQIANGKKSRDPKSEYFGMTENTIQQMWETSGIKAAELGTALHERIEHMMNISSISSNQELYTLLQKNTSVDDPLEWQYFLRFLSEYPHLVPYRTEWRIFDATNQMAGSVDMLYFDPETNTYDIYDWKRTKDILYENVYETLLDDLVKHIPNSTFHKYSLQLNVYKYILETAYQFPIGKMRLVRLHPDTETKSYELYECPDYQREVAALFHNQTPTRESR